MQGTEAEDAYPNFYTLGHTDHSIETFLGLLTAHGVKAVIDVRSRNAPNDPPHFHRQTLSVILAAFHIKYILLKELDERPFGGEPFGDCYYKLAAAVIVLPP